MDGKLGSMVVSNAQGRAVEITFDWNRGRGVGWGVEGLDSPWASFSQSFRRDAWRPWLVDRASAGAGFHGDSRTLQYAFDQIGRPVSRSGDAFAYNPRGEVTNAVLDSAVYRYAYDEIGNRESACEAGATTAYAANELNQYTEVGDDEPEYDEDGNLVDDGTRTFDWSAAGHMVEAATSGRRYECDYDHLGRRIKRTEYRRSGNRWLWVEDREYVYDGWNLVHETRTDADLETDIEYFWGPDLSGTLQGAGGVGGLVAVSIGGDYYFPGYDNNGNVIGYWDEDGELVAEYAYDAFGNIVGGSNQPDVSFPFRFSTKYYDEETYLYYYGYRYFSPNLGRWINRDPIKENGGINIYSFTKNNPLRFIDPLGQFRMITGPAYIMRGSDHKPQHMPGVHLARQIVILVNYLNMLYTRRGTKRFNATFEDFVITPNSDVKHAIDTYGDDVYLVSHGTVVVDGKQTEENPFNWRKHPNGIEMIQGFSKELVEVSYFAPHLNPQNLFGCYLSPAVRKKKEHWYSPTISWKDKYNDMYKSIFHRLGRYLFAPEEECTRRIMIFEGERDNSLPVGTRFAEAFPLPDEGTYDYEGTETEIEEMWRNLYEP